MTSQDLIKKLKWQCRRGMLELDVVLAPFLETFYADLEPSLQKEFVALLEHADPDIYTWVMGFGECQEPSLVEIIAVIRSKMNIA